MVAYTRVKAETVKNGRFILRVNLTELADGLGMGVEGKREVILNLSLEL